MSARPGEYGVLVDRNTVRFQRLLPGPPELVWDYLTKREYLSAWLVDGFIDVAPGTVVELSQDNDALPIRSEGTIYGRVTHAEPHRLLAYTWEYVRPGKAPRTTAENMLEASEVLFELEEHGEDVLLTLTHRRLPASHVPQAGAGWHAHLEYLQAHMQQRRPRSFFTNYERVLPRYVAALLRKHSSGES